MGKKKNPLQTELMLSKATPASEKIICVKLRRTIILSSPQVITIIKTEMLQGDQFTCRYLPFWQINVVPYISPFHSSCLHTFSGGLNAR